MKATLWLGRLYKNKTWFAHPEGLLLLGNTFSLVQVQNGLGVFF